MRPFWIILLLGFISIPSFAITSIETLFKNGKLTPPFTNLASELEGSVGQEPVPPQAMLLIPNGRSAQSPHTSFDDPRVTFASNRSDGRVFLGYAAKAKQIEAFAWDPDEQRYKAFVIKNFSKKSTPILKEGRDCFSCHQNEAPVFARSPWRESNGQVYPEELSPISKTAKSLIIKGKDTYKGINLSWIDQDSTEEANTTDVLVRLAAHDQQIGNICRSICTKGSQSQNLDCRSVLLQSALEELALGKKVPHLYTDYPNDNRTWALNWSYRDALFTQNSAMSLGRPETYKSFQKLIEQEWPSNGFSYPSSVLLDRDPNTNRGIKLKSEKKGIAEATAFSEHGSGLSEYVLARENSGPKITDEKGLIPVTEKPIIESSKWSKWVDPTTPRPHVGEIQKKDAASFVYANAARCFWSNMDRAKSANKLFAGKFANREMIEKAIRSEQVQTALAQKWPLPDHHLIEASLLRASGVKKANLEPCHSEALKCLDIIPKEINPLSAISQVTETKELSKGSPLLKPSEQSSPLSRVNKYCGACHGPAGKNTAIRMDSFEAFKAHKAQKGLSLLERIEHNSMPPSYWLKTNGLVGEWTKDRPSMFLDLVQ